MNGIKNFIVGFSLSLISVSFAGLLYSPLPKQKQHSPHNIKIELFKKYDTSTITPPILKKVSKYSVISATNTHEALSALEIDTINSPNDDEILSVNIDDNFIPIDYEASTSFQQAELLQNAEDDFSAMLPQEIVFDDDFSETNSPWEIAKGGTHIKNKKLLEEMESATTLSPLKENNHTISSNDQEISYKIAEKIKQSIIFPIPNEILSDEDLTPTFIKGHKKNNPSPKSKQAKKIPPQKITTTKAEDSIKVVKKVPTQETAKETDSKGILDSLSSWLSPNNEKKEKKQNAKEPPSYGSQSATTKRQIESSSNDDFVSFYETLQETTHNHQQNKILPSELKLSFQPNRAEISGQTLRWLKAFSETAKNENTYLQVRLDASTPADIQKKRLNLLYSIFINNGVDTKKIDTVFSSTEPNAFIIRSLTYK